MSTNRSPPKYKKLNMGGSSHAITKSIPSTSSTATTRSLHNNSSPLQLTSCTTVASRHASASSAETKTLLSSSASTHSLLSMSGDDVSKDFAEKNHSHYHHHYHSHHHSGYSLHQHTHHSGSESGSLSSRGTSRFGSSQSISSKRGGKRVNWGSRERAGMSFLIVIAFFAIFGLIILAELFMIDDRRVGVVVLRRGGNYGNRMGDSVPDYDNVKDDYDLLEESLIKNSKLGFVQFRDNTLQVQNAGNQENGRLAGLLLASPGGAYGFNGVAANAAGGAPNSPNVPFIPWGKVLPSKIEETLPHFPLGTPALDGDWQIVNGTRFKFFVFSAYFDKRDGGRLVRVIGATKTRGPERVWCRFWYETKRNVSNTGGAAPNGIPHERFQYTSVTVMARVKVIRENWNLKYSACFVLCPVRTAEVDVPQYVSIVARLRAPPGNLLTLRNTPWDPDFVSNHSSSSAIANDSLTGAAAISSASSTSIVSSSLPTFSQLPTEDQIPDKIAVCVKPFHFNYDQALYLMEYLEFYALLGVSHFTFYNHTIGPHAGCVLQHYMSGDIPGNLTATDVDLMTYLGQINSGTKTEELATAINQNNNANTTKSKQQPQQEQQRKHYESFNYVKPTINILPWNMRMRSQKEIRTEGLFAALNDCLYRTMYRYKYLALVDLDEFIVPRHNDTLIDLINSLNQRFRNRNTAAYSFQNAFFYLQFQDDSLIYRNMPNNIGDPQVKAALVTQRKTRRRLKLHPQKQRSKYICKPEHIVEAGNHFVWEFLPGKGSLNVPPTEAILQHYRVCEFGGNDCIKAPSIVDRTAVKYVNRLVQRVEAVYKHLKDRCDLPALPKLPKQDQQPQQESPVNLGAMDEQMINNEIKGKTEIGDGSIPKRLHAGIHRTKHVIHKKNNDNDERASEKETQRTRKSTKTETTDNMKSKNQKNNDFNATTKKTVNSDGKERMSNIRLLQGKSKNATTTTTTTTTSVPAQAPMPETNQRKRRKIVIFENDEEGVPRARLMVIDDAKQGRKN